jgi:hypothetical protein
MAVGDLSGWTTVSYSAVHYETITEAKLAGKKALQLFLSAYQVE